MTEYARIVLDDCRAMAVLLEDRLTEQQWRQHWVAAMSLIRTVGEVLEHVDAISPAQIAALNSARIQWMSLPEHRIYREFIQWERKINLEEYISLRLPPDKLALARSGPFGEIAGGSTDDLANLISASKRNYSPLRSGFWKGQDKREVLDEAIAWWQRELDRMDAYLA